MDGSWKTGRVLLGTVLLVSLATTPSLGCAEKSTTALLQETRSLRQDVVSGEIALGWEPDPHSRFADNPLLVFDSLEEIILAPEVTACLKDSAGDATALRAEIAAWAEVEEAVFISKDGALTRYEANSQSKGLLVTAGREAFLASLEIHLKEWTIAEEMAIRLRERPEVEQVQTMDKSNVEATLKMLRDSARGN